VAEGDSEHGLAHAGWSDEQHVGGVIGVAARGEVADERRVDRGLGVEVEVLDPPRGWEVREPQPACVSSGFGGVDLDVEEPGQELGVAQLLFRRGVELAGQRFGRGGEFEVGEVGSELLVDGVGAAHPTSSPSIRRR
jgi:hypothetical protein